MADSQETEQTPTAGEENVETPKTETSTPAPTTEEPQPDEQPKADEAESKDEESKTEEPPSEQPEDKAEPKSEEASIDQVAAESKSEVAGSEQAEVPPEPSAEAEKPAEGEETTKEVTETDVEGATEPAEGEKVEGEKVEGEEKEKPEGEEEEKTEGEEAAEGAEKEKVGEEEEKTEGEAVTTVGESEEDVAVAESVITPGKEDEEEGQEEERDQSPLPKSDTFEEGERPASPERIGEKLSREPTPEREPPAEPVTDIKPDSPFDEEGKHVHDTVYEEGEELEMEEEEEEAEEEVVPTFDREALIEKYHSILSEREVLQNHNLQLQTKLSDYFRKKKADERQDYDKNVTDQEQRYLKYMAQLEDLRRQDMQQRELYQNQIEDHKARCEEKRDRVDEERQKFMEFKKQIALSAINTRSGKPIAPKDTEQYLSNENKKELEVVNVRLENIKLKNKLKKKEQQLKSKEELAEGLHLIDFEQLKIENQTYNEKIEERNEELLKLRKKITSTVQVLTHLKEKLQFVQAENHVQRGNLREVEALAAQKRDILSRTKQARDSLRIDNQRLRQNCGLLGNEPLLRDFEERVDESEELRDKLERMKMIHAEMTLTCNQVRRKIEQARSGRT